MDVVTAITRDDRDIRGLLELLRDKDSDPGPLLARSRTRLSARYIAQEVHLDPELPRVEPAVEAMLRDRTRAGQSA